MKNLTEKYVNIDWSGICSDFDLGSGDISPDQSFEMDRQLGNINEILHAFIDQNKVKPVEYNVTLTSTEHNVLMVALDHMFEHLDDLVGDLETFEEENTNLKRIDAVNSLKKLFKQ